MKKILFFAVNILTCIGVATGAVRDGTAISRTKTEKNTTQTQSRTATTVKKKTSPRTTSLIPRNANSSQRTPTNNRIKSRNATTATTQKTSVKPRAASDSSFSMNETRTGAEYEQCKNTYFSCMDQFCALKNDDYRRCSCNDRVFNLAEKRSVLTNAGEQLTTFTENLDVVGMTSAQASAMRTESEGESALTNDTSASKALLQAIMNSIRGTDSNVGGKFSDLNSISISFDTTNAFGMTDSGQAIAAYNGAALYNAVYPQCRNAVRNDCNNASLQRAITAYLMAIEQDCNTVQTAIEKTQKQMKAAVREGSAMLDLARVENRQKHNSSDITTCVNAVESAILSEEVCGVNYHKCLDNGQYIDISTGKPIVGVKDFYKLEKMLTFSAGVDAVDQKLTQNPANRQFVQNFENRVKKFAADALDTCVENADFVWSEYLNKAMLDIYYAQREKVSEIKQGCFEYISACYTSGNAATNAAISQISKDNSIILQPDIINLNQRICTDYINSCNGMFNDNIIQEYVENMQNTDLTTACRAVVKQCFDRYGGLNYENFYYPYSGLFERGHALDWFSLYDQDGNYKSECAKQLTKISACNTPEMIEGAFGGFDIIDSDKYGIVKNNETFEEPRPRGVATEVYNQIVSILSTQCMNLQGRFLEKHYISKNSYKSDNPCISTFTQENSSYYTLVNLYFIGENEDMCPQYYDQSVDTTSWGACLCWENGARRSKWGKSTKCVAAIPTKDIITSDAFCITEENNKYQAQFEGQTSSEDLTAENWCIQPSVAINKDNQVCPYGYIKSIINTNECEDITDSEKTISQMPNALK